MQKTWTRQIGTLSALILAVSLGQTARADTTYDTVPFWDGNSTISPFGNPNTSTYGQTFVAPLTDTLLTDFTFFVNASTGTTLTFKAHVFAWTGPLTGNGGQATGAALFSSSSTTLNGNGAFQTVLVNTGGVNLIGGQNYVALLTVSDPADYANTTGTSSWGLNGSHSANNGGGGFVFFNHADNAALLNTATWDTFGDFGDLAWRANFTGGAVGAPEPSSFALLGLLGVPGASLLMRRRK
jgi:hypothetical protein